MAFSIQFLIVRLISSEPASCRRTEIVTFGLKSFRYRKCRTKIHFGRGSYSISTLLLPFFRASGSIPCQFMIGPSGSHRIEYFTAARSAAPFMQRPSGTQLGPECHWIQSFSKFAWTDITCGRVICRMPSVATGSRSGCQYRKLQAICSRIENGEGQFSTSPTKTEPLVSKGHRTAEAAELWNRHRRLSRSPAHNFE
jgi:hypothetical protein